MKRRSLPAVSLTAHLDVAVFALLEDLKAGETAVYPAWDLVVIDEAHKLRNTRRKLFEHFDEDVASPTTSPGGRRPAWIAKTSLAL